MVIYRDGLFGNEGNDGGKGVEESTGSGSGTSNRTLVYRTTRNPRTSGSTSAARSASAKPPNPAIWPVV